jgi:hypothetical protein
MATLNRAQAKRLIDAGAATQFTVCYSEENNITYGVLNNTGSGKADLHRVDHYPIGTGDLRGEVPETTPTFDRT